MSEAAGSTRQEPSVSEVGRSRSDPLTYDLFIGLLTILSLGIVAFSWLAASPQVDAILLGTDSLICLVFLFDTFRCWLRAPDRWAYVIGVRPGRSLPTGIVDLLGSVPGIRPLRILRLFRLNRVRHDLAGRHPEDLITDLTEHRAEAVLYGVTMLTILVMLFGSVLIAVVEPSAPGSNIKTGGDAFWWAWVTITTVGYGDRFPVTDVGRVIGMFTMAVGIVIFGVLTSFLAQSFIRAPGRRLPMVKRAKEATASSGAAAETATMAASIAAEGPWDTQLATADDVRALRDEIVALRRLVEALADPRGT